MDLTTSHRPKQTTADGIVARIDACFSRRGGQLAFNADGWGGQIICVIPSLDMVIVLKSEAENPGAHGYYELLDTLIEAGS